MSRTRLAVILAVVLFFVSVVVVVSAVAWTIYNEVKRLPREEYDE